MNRDEQAECAGILLDRIGHVSRVHLVLGSGLSGLLTHLLDPVEVPFHELPGLPSTSVTGHSGRFLAGTMAGIPVLAQAGRYHFYEGFGPEVVTAPIRLGQDVGADVLIVTNAAGGIRRDLVPGSLMLIDDHVNLMFRSPLAGPVHEGDLRFPDMSAPYDSKLMVLAEAAALTRGISLPRGTYGAVLGPSYETPAEVRAIAQAGIDAVGMSTVPEVICARARGQRVLGFSMISNLAAGLGAEPLAHEEVMRTGKDAGGRLGDLLLEVLPAVLA